MTQSEDVVVYLITHGEKANGRNPPLSPKGEDQAKAIKEHLPFNPEKIQWRIGMGLRHLETARHLKAPLYDREVTKYSPLAGIPASTADAERFWLYDGKTIHPDQYIGAVEQFGKWIVEEAIANGSLAVVTSRENIAPFNDDQPGKPGTIYRLTLLPDDEINRSYLNRRWEFEEVFVAE